MCFLNLKKIKRPLLKQYVFIFGHLFKTKLGVSRNIVKITTQEDCLAGVRYKDLTFRDV